MASSIETNLITDTALDGHTAFHTTLQVVTSQGCKNLQVKVDPGAESSIIPLSRFCSAFPKHFSKSGALKKSALQPMYATWSAHDGKCRHLLGYIVLNIQHKTTPQILPIKFYVFEDHHHVLLLKICCCVIDLLLDPLLVVVLFILTFRPLP